MTRRLRCGLKELIPIPRDVSKYARKVGAVYPEGQGIDAPPAPVGTRSAKKLHLVAVHIHNRFRTTLVLPSGRVPPSGLGILPVRSPAVQTPVQVEQALDPDRIAIHIPRDAVDTRSRHHRVEPRCSASGVMWWKSAVRRSFWFLSAAFRIRAAACGTLARHWVRRVLWQSEFPLVEALSSGDSAEARAPLFAALTGRMASSDFFKPFIIGFGFLHSLRGPFTTIGAV